MERAKAGNNRSRSRIFFGQDYFKPRSSARGANGALIPTASEDLDRASTQ